MVSLVWFFVRMEARATSGIYHETSLEVSFGTPLFLFCCFRTTGSNLLTDEVSEVAVKCWPYQEHVPSFHYQILTHQTTYVASNCKKHGRLPHAVRELCLWIERTVKEVSATLQENLYPVLLSHGGDSVDFLFFFRSLAKQGLDLSCLANLKIHFTDPVPLLELLKLRRHPLIVESKYLTLGSLLNDWFPGHFDPADLNHLPSRASLTAQLYTQTTLYPVLNKVPLYNIAEWNQYYQDAINYKQDKRELESHMPKHVKEVQAKFGVRSILRAGYNWTKLLELYKSCSSPLQFRQELRDMDVQSSTARAIAWMVTDMKLEQNGSRPYVLRIRKQMSPQEYIGFMDPRAYYFVLRVANKFPKCFLTLADLEFSLEDNPIDTPEGFSFTQRLSPKSFCATCGGTSPTSSYGHDFNGNEVFGLNFVDPATSQEWEEEEKGSIEDVEERFEAYCRFQQEKEEKEHKITSFVMGSTFKKSLLLNRMEEEDLEDDPEPTVSEEVRQRRLQAWSSMMESITKQATSQPSKILECDLSYSNKGANNIEDSQSKPSRKGSRKGARRNFTNVKKWNNCQDMDSNKMHPNLELAKNAPVALPKERVGCWDIVNQSETEEMSVMSKPSGMSRSVGDSGASKTVSNNRGKLCKVNKVIEKQRILFVEHQFGSGVDIIYPSLMKVESEKCEQESISLVNKHQAAGKVVGLKQTRSQIG